MSAPLPLFPVTTVGSWPRPRWLLDAVKRKDPDLPALRDRACLEALRAQEAAGVDILTDGEQRRDNFYSFLCERVEGMTLMTMADLLDFVEDRAGFEAMLSALDVPAYAMRNPTVTGPLRARGALVLDDVRFLRRHTRGALKATLPGPYLLSRSTWVKGLSDGAYPTREALADDIVRLLRAEIEALAAEGVAFIQMDEPVLSEVLFAGRSATRTFMCAALAAKSSPEGEMELAVDLLRRVTEGIRGPVLGIHVCRGNWSRDDGVLLAGDYDPLMPWFARMDLGLYALEWATPRAGPVEVLAGLPRGAILGFGAVNPRTTEVEDPETVAARVRRVAAILGPERVQLNPDCGFGTFAERPVNDADTARRKLETLAAAAAILRRG
ncbi:MAG: cobalamin-independent methionine synthase II family protein [Planctomycetaceae bacterium]|nr:cobalamin-independent methionine synthase II family protein [Planctomycetota bacterium]NUN53054.1 cobalamin-independent methionine synthase II family protein [Planctomycetaceae bacterium]